MSTSSGEQEEKNLKNAEYIAYIQVTTLLPVQRDIVGETPCTGEIFSHVEAPLL